MDHCLFCSIVSGTVPASIVHIDEHVIALEDINPVAPVHLLIIPKKHIVNVLHITEADLFLIGHVHFVAARLVAERGFAEEGFRIVTNTNGAAGQSVFHIHFHLLAGRKLHWPPG